MSDTFRPGDPWPPNDWFNDQLAEARKNRVVATSAGLDKSGPALSLYRSPRIWAKVSGSANPYSFAEATPNASGGFDPIPGGRTDAGGRQPAFEINGGRNLGGTYQRLRWSTAGDWRFEDVGSGASAPSGMVTTDGCYCPVPMSLVMTSLNPGCNYGMFQSCTLSYQYPPSCFQSLNVTGKIILSDSTFTDRFSDSPFYYYLFCQYNEYLLTRLFCTSPYGSPFRDAALYSWLVGGYGNNCDPFYLHQGKPFPGSDASCGVLIDPA